MGLHSENQQETEGHMQNIHCANFCGLTAEVCVCMTATNTEVMNMLSASLHSVNNCVWLQDSLIDSLS